jgi:hypothetical protein
MSQREERGPSTDQPEPEEVLTEGDESAASDHERTDTDDRPVDLDEPDRLELPVDDEDRDPVQRERT